MNTTSRSFIQIRIIYAATTLFLVALSVYTFIQIKNLTDSYELISHTNQVTQSLQSILTDIIQAEDSKRGFLLSGEISQLQDRNLSLSKMTLEYNLLSKLINDNPVQQNNLKLLSIRIGEKVASVMNLPHQTHQTLHDFETKQNTHVGVLTMQNVINQINLMTATESALLVHRKKYYNQITLITPLFLIFLFLGALIILWASYL